MFLRRLYRLSGLGLAILLSFTTAPFFEQSAWAASCCVGGGGQSICVLPSEQNYQMGVSTSYRLVEGQFDPYGAYSKSVDDSVSQSIRTVVGVAYRLNDDWQLGLNLPIVHNRKIFKNKFIQGTGPGDITAEARYSFWEDLAFLRFQPSIAFYSGVRLPMGRSVYSSRDPSDADVTGSGVGALHFGVNFSKLYRPFRLVLDGNLSQSFSKNVTEMRGNALLVPYSIRPGNVLELSESIGFLANERMSASMGFRQRFTSLVKMDGAEVSGSAARIFSTSLGLQYFYAQAWMFGVSYETPFPFYSYLANEAYSHTVVASAIFGGF